MCCGMAMVLSPPPLPMCQRFFDDDDDEALQAVLLASLMGEHTEEHTGEEQAQPPASAQQQEALSRCEAPPLLCRPGSLAAYGGEGGFSSEAQQALAAMEAAPLNLRLVRVRGDGHCLFRACGAALVLGAAWGGREAVASLRARLGARAAEESCASEVAALLLQMLGHADAAATDAFDALCVEGEEARSDRLVHALRMCAVGYMRLHEARFRLQCDCGDWAEYCAGMEGMGAAPRYGGHGEMVALSECLGVRIDIFDMGAVAASASPAYRVGEQLLSSTKLPSRQPRWWPASAPDHQLQFRETGGIRTPQPSVLCAHVRCPPPRPIWYLKPGRSCGRAQWRVRRSLAHGRLRGAALLAHRCARHRDRAT